MSELAAETLERIADAICDDSPVDWNAELRSEPELAKRIEQLRDLQNIARAYRTAPAGDAAGAAESRTVTVQVEAPPGPRSEPEPTMPLTWGPLRILERLDGGAFGDVYRAYDPSLQREVALKLLRLGRGASAESTARLLDEARSLARIRHPNVLVVHGVAENDGRPGIWMDLVRGRSLQDLVAMQGPLGLQEATFVGIELCRALAALHAAGLVHRDVKPANVMREQGGRIVLMDFGSAIEHLRSDVPPRLEGTPLTMAPELLIGGVEPSPCSDIYSLGVLLYWMVSGRYPIETANFEELRERHRRRDAVRLRDVRADLPTAFVQVVERALEPDPARRYKSAGELERELARAAQVGTEPESAVVATEPARPDEPRPSSATPAGPEKTHEGWRFHGRTLAWAVPAAAAIALAVWIVAPRILPLQVDVALYRQGPGIPEALSTGGSVRVGDHLFLEIEGSRPMYVYAVNEDELGQVFALFPAEWGARNPLQPHIRHRLPSDASGEPSSWLITDAAGGETILVLASTQPREDVESELRRYPRPAEGQGKQRGLGRVLPEPGAGSTTRRLERLASLREDTRVWKIRVRSVGP